MAMAMALCLLHTVCARAAPVIHGAGSTAAAPIYRSWADEYQKARGVGFAYEAVGSSAGLKSMDDAVTDFGASDLAPPDADLARQNLLLLPIAITGISPVVNLPKVADGQLRLTGDVLARIYSGELVRWNAPAIAELNPHLNLPSSAIVVVVRADGSGTTFNFTDYLSKTSAHWQSTFGAHTTIAWPLGCVAVKGSSGVVKALKETPGAIGYVDFGYVRDNKLTGIALKNADGEYVQAGIPGFKAALANSTWVSQGKFVTTLTNQSGKTAWPLTMGTFALLHQTATDAERAQRTLNFFVWAFMHGDRLVQLSNFVQLPDRVQAAAFRALSSVHDRAGKPLSMQVLDADLQKP